MLEGGGVKTRRGGGAPGKFIANISCCCCFLCFKNGGLYLIFLWVSSLTKGDVTRDDSQRRFVAQRSVATLFLIVTTLFEHCNAVLR